jgi:hypothetical protein
MARLRDAMAPGSYLVISHAGVPTAHAVGTQRTAPALRELGEAVKAFQRVPARTEAEVAGFFGDLTLVEPGLTDIGAWRPDGDTVTTTTEVMRILGGQHGKIKQQPNRAEMVATDQSLTLLSVFIARMRQVGSVLFPQLVRVIKGRGIGC